MRHRALKGRCWRGSGVEYRDEERERERVEEVIMTKMPILQKEKKVVLNYKKRT